MGKLEPMIPFQILCFNDARFRHIFFQTFVSTSTIYLYDIIISLCLYDTEVSLYLYDVISLSLYDIQVSLDLYDESFGVF